jgi:hypothetical protein
MCLYLHLNVACGLAILNCSFACCVWVCTDWSLTLSQDNRLGLHRLFCLVLCCIYVGRSVSSRLSSTQTSTGSIVSPSSRASSFQTKPPLITIRYPCRARGHRSMLNQVGHRHNVVSWAAGSGDKDITAPATGPRWTL